MPNNVNISDYEKIIFINNISENNSQKDLLTDQNYGFAVFFTNNTDLPANWPSSAWGSKVKNIWYGGQRLNRFIGIDQNNCVLNVGNHTVKLTFNYEKGLLGITDTNNLAKIEVYNLHFIDAHTGEVSDTPLLNNTIINAKDNIFVLTIRFYGEPGNDIDISKIIDGINIKYNGTDASPIQLLGLNGQGTLSEDGTTIDKQYRFKIVSNAEKNPNSTPSYTIIPDYDNGKSTNISLKSRLNPTSIDVIRRSSNSPAKSPKPYNNLSADFPETYDVNILPNSGEVYTYPEYDVNNQIYLCVSTSSKKACTIDDNSTTVKYIQIGPRNTFDLIMHPIDDINESVTADIKVSVVYKDENGYHEFASDTENNLTYTFKVTVGGNNGDVYYVGYENPTLDTFNTNLLKLLDDVDVLYDYEDTNKGGNLVDDKTKEFYVAIPVDQISNISPRWDGFTVSGRTSTYCHFGAPCNTWTTRFTQFTTKPLKGINCAIFKNAEGFTGKFYGKIQKIN